MEHPNTPVHAEEIKALEARLKSLKANSPRGLPLQPSDKPDLKRGLRKNGRAYSVRDNRDRFFFPHEWMTFFDALTDGQKMTFEFLVNTGARIKEAQNVKVADIDTANRRLILRVTKVKARKAERAPRPRMISISSQFAQRLNKYIKDQSLADADYLKLLSTPASHIALKKTLQHIGIKDWHMFSIHNIRKTHGNWLKALGVEMGEICNRLGHDYDTFLKSYASPDIFTFKDRQDIRAILGDLYQR